MNGKSQISSQFIYHLLVWHWRKKWGVNDLCVYLIYYKDCVVSVCYYCVSLLCITIVCYYCVLPLYVTIVCYYCVTSASLFSLCGTLNNPVYILLYDLNECSVWVHSVWVHSVCVFSQYVVWALMRICSMEDKVPQSVKMYIPETKFVEGIYLLHENSASEFCVIRVFGWSHLFCWFVISVSCVIIDFVR